MIVIFDTNDEYNIKYLLTLLNSKLLTFRYRTLGKQTGNGMYEYFPNGISKLPIPEISLEEQQVFIDLADKMMELNKNFFSCKTPKDEKILKLQISKTDDKINQLVYELYGLNEDEIRIIEEALENNS